MAGIDILYRCLATLNYLCSGQTARGTESGSTQSLRDHKAGESCLCVGTSGLVYTLHPHSKVVNGG